jgi:acetamidase/formamidase
MLLLSNCPESPFMTDHKHTIHKHQGHHGWNNAFPPRLTIAPGESVRFETADASGGQLTPASTVADVAKLDFALVNPVTGPVLVDGARPGDALKVTVLSLKPAGPGGAGWGWTANIPGFGLLADQFPDPALHLWKYDTSLAPAMYGPGGRVPLKPFTGTIGVAPAAPGLHSIVPPRNVGGNMDVRDIAEGTELWLPIEVEGALFSVGDTHAAQGDGEVCGTAIESPIDVALKFDLVKGANLKMPRFRTPGPVSRHLDGKGYEVTTGIGPDLMTGARTAVSEMVELLARRFGYAPVDAYMLCSVCADLRISSIVDVPNWVVSLYFPRIVLE